MEQKCTKDKKLLLRKIVLVGFIPFLAIFFLGLLPNIYEKYQLISVGKWEKRTDVKNLENAEIIYNIEALKYWNRDSEVTVELDTYALWGWAFLDNQMKTQQYETSIILFGDNSVGYEFSAKSFPRPGVAEVFSYKGIDGLIDSGFFAVINRRSLEKGTYQVGILLKVINSNEKFFIRTNSKIICTANHLRFNP